MMADLGVFTSCEHLHIRNWTKDLYFLQVFGPRKLSGRLFTCRSKWLGDWYVAKTARQDVNVIFLPMAKAL